MKKRIKRVYCDTDKDVLLNRTVAEGDSKTVDTVVQEAYAHKKKCMCYIYSYLDKNGDREKEQMTGKKRKNMNEYLEYVGSPSRIFVNKKEFAEYNAQSIKPVLGLNGEKI
ncbi:MAG: hypothetical protein KOO65_08595 [Desulfobacterales bacterium]|nr:hypothetical protein [Desulfobacterales bacterium]